MDTCRARYISCVITGPVLVVRLLIKKLIFVIHECVLSVRYNRHRVSLDRLFINEVEIAALQNDSRHIQHCNVM